MKKISRPQPHRKFIAFILALSVTVTGFSAAPARADEDVAKFIAGMVALGLIGAAVNDARKDRKHQPQVHTHKPQVHDRNRGRYDSHKHRARPLPAPVAKYDLPGHCLRNPAGHGHSVLSQRCLSREYSYTHSLPGQCRVSVRDSYGTRTAYGTRCLRKHGYRLVSR